MNLRTQQSVFINRYIRHDENDTYILQNDYTHDNAYVLSKNLYKNIAEYKDMTSAIEDSIVGIYSKEVVEQDILKDFEWEFAELPAIATFEDDRCVSVEYDPEAMFKMMDDQSQIKHRIVTGLQPIMDRVIIVE